MEATEGVSQPPQATDLAQQNTVNHVSGVVYCRGALCDQCHVTPLPPPASVFLLELSVCEAKLIGLCVCLSEGEKCCKEGGVGCGG